MIKNIHDGHGSVSNIFAPYLRDLLLEIWKIYEIFELKTSFFFIPKQTGGGKYAHENFKSLFLWNQESDSPQSRLYILVCPLRKGMCKNKNDYGWISLGRIISFGESQDIISFHCFIVTWVILLYASLLWIDGLYLIRIIVARVILLY